MKRAKISRFVATAALLSILQACGGLRSSSDNDRTFDPLSGGSRGDLGSANDGTTSLFEALNRNRDESNVSVNRYIWSASLEVLDFLPIQSVDPFSGVIVTGFGAPPNGGQTYRATILIRDPALEARSLNVSLQTRGGPASAATVRAIEDAILTRARQLRSRDNRL